MISTFKIAIYIYSKTNCTSEPGLRMSPITAGPSCFNIGKEVIFQKKKINYYY